jgi:hypothetical protein
MDSETTKRRQVARLREAVRATFAYLHRLGERTGQVGFHASDPLFQRVDQANNAMHSLFVAGGDTIASRTPSFPTPARQMRLPLMRTSKAIMR